MLGWSGGGGDDAGGWDGGGAGGHCCFACDDYSEADGEVFEGIEVQVEVTKMWKMRVMASKMRRLGRIEIKASDLGTV